MRLPLPLAGATAAFLLGLAGCSGEPAPESGQDAGTTSQDETLASAATDSADAANLSTQAEPDVQNPQEQQAGQVTPAPAASPTATAATPAPAAAPARPAQPPMAYMQCRSCHSVEPGKHGIGPSLHGIFGQKAASVPGFNYTPALQKSGITWNRASLDTWLKAPIQMVPGSRMVVGVPDAERRKAIIDYLETLE